MCFIPSASTDIQFKYVAINLYIVSTNYNNIHCQLRLCTNVDIAYISAQQEYSKVGTLFSNVDIAYISAQQEYSKVGTPFSKNILILIYEELIIF